MRQVLILFVLLTVSQLTVAQENAPKPTLSDVPLTSEQIAVYRALLTDYLKKSTRVLNLASVTESLDVAGIDSADNTCLKGFGAEHEAVATVHRLSPQSLGDTRLVLVDPDRQQEAIKDNDPQNLLRKAIDDHQKITDEQLDQSIKGAFRAGLFTLSEIAFDKAHRRAVVSYSFVCGMLCGHGNTLVLKKVGQSWRVAKGCGGWVS